VFHQLAHDLYLPKGKNIIRRVVMFSNGPGVVPKSAASSQEQFDELLTALDIPLNTPAAEKLSILRRTPVDKLIDASLNVTHHQYRPWNDGQFVSKSLFEDIDNGDFFRRMLDRNVRLMNGECRDEHFLYGTWHTPSENSLASLRQRLEVDYPREACSALINLYYPDGKLPANCADWQDAFGRIYADAQVHMLERGFVNALANTGAGHLVFRYRIEYRVKCVPLPPHWGVTHSSDVAMWFWGNGMLLEEDEKQIVSVALIEPLARFVRGEEDVRWTQQAQSEGEEGIRQVRRLRPDGQVDIWRDEMFDRGVKVWEAVRKAQSAVTAKL
jgi:carboxylesterase type B